jgi:hypothetical protein
MLQMIITVLIGVYVAGSVYIIWNLLKKTETQELALMSMYAQISTVLYTMKVLDERQMFESDDEVGTVYAQVSNTVKSLQIILGENIDGIETTEE